MPQPGQDHRLVLEAFLHVDIRADAEDLDGDPAFETQIEAAVHIAGATRTDDFVQAKPSTQYFRGTPGQGRSRLAEPHVISHCFKRCCPQVRPTSRRCTRVPPRARNTPAALRRLGLSVRTQSTAFASRVARCASMAVTGRPCSWGPPGPPRTVLAHVVPPSAGDPMEKPSSGLASWGAPYGRVGNRVMRMSAGRHPERPGSGRVGVTHPDLVVAVVRRCEHRRGRGTGRGSGRRVHDHAPRAGPGRVVEGRRPPLPRVGTASMVKVMPRVPPVVGAVRGAGRCR